MKAVYQQPQTVQSVAREPHKCERVLGHKICMHSLAARPKTHLLQIGTYDVSIHPRNLSVLPTVMFHPCFRHDIQTTAAVFYLTSSGSSAGSSLYSRQAGVSGFGWCHRLERPASPRRICAVTRGVQTTTQDLSVFPFLPRHYHMTRVLLSPFITTV